MRRIWSILMAFCMLLGFAGKGLSGDKAPANTSPGKWGHLSTGSKSSVGPAKRTVAAAKATTSKTKSFLSGMLPKALGGK